jgi:predicted RNase H-like HicB family nuclease
MRYALVIDRAGGNYSAYAPNLPGCVSTGETPDRTEGNIRNTIRVHLEGIRAGGLAIPEPATICEYVEA